MTVISPNSVAGINSITVQSGNSLAVHKANGELIRTLTSSSGISTFSSISVGTAATDNSAGKSINIGLGASISQHNANTLSFGTGGDERALIDSSGRLMVGHNSSLAIGGGDNSPLQVSATSSVVFGGARYVNSSSGPFLSLAKSRATTAGSNTIVQDGDELGTILFAGDDGTDLISKGAQIQGQVDGTPGSNDMPGRLVFYTTADGAASPTERLRIDSSGLVGIGSQSPGGVLDLYHATSNTILNVKSGDTGAVINIIDSSTRSSIEQNGTSLKIISDTSGTLANSDMRLQVDGATMMLINSDSQILMGGTSAYNNFENSSTAPRLQVRGTNLSGSCQAWIRATADAGAPKLFLANTRNTSGNGHTIVQDGDELGGLFFTGSDGSQFVNGAAIVASVDGTPGADDMPGQLDIQTTADGASSPTTRMRFEENGDIRIGNYGTLFGNTGFTLFGSSLSGGPQVQMSRENANPILLNRNGSDGDIVEFRKGWGAGGTITIATNSVTYNTSSDYRLKENIVAITDGITRLKTLKPSRFNWIGDTSSTRDGFIAHEVTAVPEAISGTKDEIYTESDSTRNIKSGDPKYQGIDQSKLVPLLTAALQEAITKIETLETKVAALEGG